VLLAHDLHPEAQQGTLLLQALFARKGSGHLVHCLFDQVVEGALLDLAAELAFGRGRGNQAVVGEIDHGLQHVALDDLAHERLSECPTLLALHPEQSKALVGSLSSTSLEEFSDLHTPTDDPGNILRAREGGVD
jgi:hypothetical protein